MPPACQRTRGQAAERSEFGNDGPQPPVVERLPNRPSPKMKYATLNPLNDSLILRQPTRKRPLISLQSAKPTPSQNPNSTHFSPNQPTFRPIPLPQAPPEAKISKRTQEVLIHLIFIRLQTTPKNLLHERVL